MTISYQETATLRSQKIGDGLHLFDVCFVVLVVRQRRLLKNLTKYEKKKK